MEEIKKVNEGLEEVDGGRRFLNRPESDLAEKPGIDLVTKDGLTGTMSMCKPKSDPGSCRPAPKCKPSSNVV